MRHVFIETNWVVAYSAPVHERMPEALELAEKAKRGDIRLHLPSICISEARHPIRSKYQPRRSADSIRRFLASPQASDIADSDLIRQALDRFESSVLAQLDELPTTLQQIHSMPGIEVFALDEQMLSRCVKLSFEDLESEAVRSRHFGGGPGPCGATPQPRRGGVVLLRAGRRFAALGKKGASKQPLASLYDQARVWVFQDFSMEYPPLRELGFFRQQA